MDETNLQPNTQPSPSGAQTHDLDADEIMFIGKNEDYFRDKWASRNEGGRPKISWNWMAFLLPPIWLAYRKMYWQTAVYLVLSLVITIAANRAGSPFGLLLINTVPFAIGFCGNRLYWEHMRHSLAELRSHNCSADLFSARVRNRGGVSIMAALVMTALMLLGVLIIVALVASALASLRTT